MSLTQVDSSSHNTGIHVELWQQKLLMQAGEKIFWEGLSGAPGSGMPIIRDDELTAKAGGLVHVPMQRRMTGAGVSGSNPLSGNEEALIFDDLPLTPTLRRNAAASHKADQKRTIHDLKKAAGLASAIWLADEIDDSIFGVLDNQAINRLYGGSATSKATLTTADTMSAAMIARARAKAKAVHIKPLKIGGREWYILVLHPFQAYSLREDSVWLNAQQYAAPRGSDNPILGMSMGSYQGVLVFENDRVESGDDAGSLGNVDYAIGHLVGGDAVGFSWAQYPAYIQEVRDYGAVIGAGAEGIFGCAAAVFNSVPTGHVPIMTAAADPT